MNYIQENIEKLRQQIPPYVTIVAVSKTHSVQSIEEAYRAGISIFGENKVQELVQKAKTISQPVQWHMIGHLQTNKVKTLLPHVTLIHSLDSLKLAKEINKESQKIQKITPCLLQVHIAKEETKFGFDEYELSSFLNNPDLPNLSHIKICGLMGMATFTDDTVQIRKEFSTLRKLFDKLKTTYFANNPDFKELSMGMSNDFKIAIDEGSTMIRVGSIIFGQRNYT
ncbi:MAG: YggS family pyridoxal phosphate-dependent enzyme [Bacteroidales bacterium]|nr:YggS family pyridoxal phosphate-dependent enzyme [Bacteroidales bacterium]